MNPEGREIILNVFGRKWDCIRVSNLTKDCFKIPCFLPNSSSDFFGIPEKLSRVISYFAFHWGQVGALTFKYSHMVGETECFELESIHWMPLRPEREELLDEILKTIEDKKQIET